MGVAGSSTSPGRTRTTQPPTRTGRHTRREAVLAAALEIIGRDGADVLPMDRLSATLGSVAGRHRSYYSQEPSIQALMTRVRWTSGTDL